MEVSRCVVLIAGYTGFIGSSLIECLKKNDQFELIFVARSNGFNLEDYILSSPTFARQKFPKKWKTLHNTKLKDGSYQSWTVSGNDFMGINPYLLQLALGNIEIKR